MAESAGYWSPTRLNGAPLEPGTVCWVTTVPGQNPIPIYGKTAQDVIEKLSAAQAYAQAELARRTSAPAATPVVETVTPGRRRLTADQMAQATSDLGNPAKAGDAAALLVQDATGIDLRKLALDKFATMAMHWQAANPDFYVHPGNKRLLTDQAKALVGGDLTMVTPEILTQAFNILRTRGELMQAPMATLPPNPNDPNPASSTTPAVTFPGESQVQRTERPRGAFATGMRSTRFSAPGSAPAKTPKYTKQELIAMPLAMEKELDKPSHPDHQAFVEAYEFHFGKAAMSA